MKLGQPRARLGAGLLFAAAFVFPSSAQEWSQFRGPEAQGVATSSELPLSWGTEAGIAWRTPLNGEGWSSPSQAGPKILVTLAVPNDADGFELRTQAYNEADGGLLWDTLVFEEKASAPGIHGKNSHASPTPLVDNDRIFVHFGHLGTACLSLGGDILWKTQEIAYEPVHGAGGSPVLVDEKLIFSCDGAKEPFVVALDATNGKELWRWERTAGARKNFSFCTPLVLELEGKTQVIIPGSDIVDALDPETGRPLWWVRYTGYSVVPRPLFADGLVFISTGFDRPSLLAIDPTGMGDVTETHVRWKSSRSISKTPSFVYKDGMLFVLSDNGILSCFDAKTGETHWSERIDGAYSASLLLSGDRVYATSEEGVTKIVEASQTFREIAVNDLEERSLASAMVLESDLVIRTADALYRIRGSQP